MIDRLYELQPKNPRLAQDAVSAYVHFRHPLELDAFFRRQLDKQKQDAESVGNLLFHRGNWNLQNGRKADARSTCCSRARGSRRSFRRSTRSSRPSRLGSQVLMLQCPRSDAQQPTL